MVRWFSWFLEWCLGLEIWTLSVFYDFCGFYGFWTLTEPQKPQNHSESGSVSVVLLVFLVPGVCLGLEAWTLSGFMVFVVFMVSGPSGNHKNHKNHKDGA